MTTTETNRTIRGGATTVVVIPASLARDTDIQVGASSFVAIYDETGTPADTARAFTDAIRQAIERRGK